MRGTTQVRYVSRKRLAEARPRVRGQFVKAEVAAAFFAAQQVRFVIAFDMCFDTKCFFAVQPSTIPCT